MISPQTKFTSSRSFLPSACLPASLNPSHVLASPFPANLHSPCPHLCIGLALAAPTDWTNLHNPLCPNLPPSDRAHFCATMCTKKPNHKNSASFHIPFPLPLSLFFYFLISFTPPSDQNLHSLTLPSYLNATLMSGYSLLHKTNATGADKCHHCMSASSQATKAAPVPLCHNPYGSQQTPISLSSWPYSSHCYPRTQKQPELVKEPLWKNCSLLE